jgi:hypothetical protein
LLTVGSRFSDVVGLTVHTCEVNFWANRIGPTHTELKQGSLGVADSILFYFLSYTYTYSYPVHIMVTNI